MSLQAALQELEELKQIVPKESLVYFLIGKVTSPSVCLTRLSVRPICLSVCLTRLSTRLSDCPLPACLSLPGV